MIARRILRLLALSALAFAPTDARAWPHSPTANVLVAPTSSTPMALSDGAGGAYVVYHAYHDATNGYDMYAQHYDRSGSPTWAPGGVLLCAALDTQFAQAIVSDGAGGFVAIWGDYRANAVSGMDLYAQRVNPGGGLLWAASGVPVCTALGNQDGVRALSNANGVWIVWQDARNSGTTGVDIYAQRLTMSGAASMAGNGAVVCNAANNQFSPDLAVDEYDRAMIAWSDSRSGTDDIYAILLTSSGFWQWAVNGVAVSTAANYQTSPRVQLIAGDRAVIAWSDSRSLADYDIYAQRVEFYNGAAGWAANGIPVAVAGGNQFLSDMTRDTGGNVVLAWSDSRAGAFSQDLYAQKVDIAGNLAWGSGGYAVHVGAGPSSSARVVSDQVGGTLFAWQDGRIDYGDVYAQRLSASGYLMWPAAGVPVCTAASTQQYASACEGAPGGLIVAWADNRPINWGTYIQAVDEWGYLGAEPVIAGVKDVPNDQGGQVKVSWYASPLDTDPLYRNISDYVVFRSVPASLAARLARVATAEGATLEGRRYVRTRSAAQDYFWEELAHVPPRHLASYSYVAATEGDSVAGSNPRTAFMVMALGNYGSAWWVTKADSGYSVDDLAPAAPAPLTGQYAAGSTALHWNPNAEADLAGYRLYRGATAGFAIGAASLVAELPDTGYVDAAAAPYFYKLTAVDTHGNESPVAMLLPAGTTGVETGAPRAEFAAPAPNPMRGGRGATLRFSLPAAGPVRLAIYDAQGRTVRMLATGSLDAGAHAVAFDGRDRAGRALAPGLYLARLDGPGLGATRRIVVIE